MPSKTIAVVGAPGAWTHRVAKQLEQQDMLILWPNQDIDYEGGKSAYGRGENPELIKMHEEILFAADEGWFTANAPKYYDVPFPGPPEYLSRFPKQSDVVLVDPRMSFFLPMWTKYLTHVVVCEVPTDEAARQMKRWMRDKPHIDLCRKVARHYDARINESVADGSPRLVRMSFESIRNNDFLPTAWQISQL